MKQWERKNEGNCDEERNKEESRTNEVKREPLIMALKPQKEKSVPEA